jgi:hypothetical protein
MFTKNIETCKFGDIVLANLPYIDDLTRYKLRPILILKKDRNDYLMMKITSQKDVKEAIDILVHPDDSNGLEEDSLFKIGKIVTYAKEILFAKI